MHESRDGRGAAAAVAGARATRLRTALAGVAALTVGCWPDLPVAQASPGPLVFPGMEIHQDNNACTVAFVDAGHGVAYTAGHCRGSGTVTDRDGAVIGHQVDFADNTPDGSTITADHLIIDWETIAVTPGIATSDVLPGGRRLVLDAAPTLVPGQSVCHFGVVSGESCGTVDAVNNGWFTMAGGMVSHRGDSGGAVYVPTDDGRGVVVGMFNSTWGDAPAGVTWQSVVQPGAAAIRLAGIPGEPA